MTRKFRRVALWTCRAGAMAALVALASISPRAAAQGITFLDSFGSLGSGVGLFNTPSGVAVTDSGLVYVADTSNHRVQRFDEDGIFQLTIGALGSGAGQFNSPNGVAVASNGQLYVVDTENDRVQRFDSAGAHQLSFGSLGSSAGAFNTPRGVAVSGGVVYVADTSNNRAQRFDAAGSHQDTIGGPGTLTSPRGVAVSPGGLLYVADTSNNRIRRFDAEGDLQLSFGTDGSGAGQFSSPYGVTVSGTGLVYVADTNNNRVQRFDAAGVHQVSFGAVGQGAGQFRSPRGVAVSDTGLIYVADATNNRVQRWFSPREWTQPHTHDFAAVTIGENLILSPGKNLNVGGLTTINGAGGLTLAGGLFNTTGLAIQAGGNVIVQDDQTLVTSTFANAGQLTLLGGLAQVNSNSVNAGAISGHGVLQAPVADPVGGVYGLTNTGGMAFSGGTTDVLGSFDNAGAGQLSIVGGGVLTFHNTVRHNSTQPMLVGPGSRLVFLRNQSGPGVFSGTGTVEYNGSLLPGSSPGLISYGGDLLLGNNAALEIELGGLTPGSQYDQLVVQGSATIAGSLNVSLINNFSLGFNQQFTIANVGGARSGHFANLNEGGLVGNFGGRDLFITYKAGDGNDVALFTSPGLTGDFDGDGDVDGADLNQWGGDFAENAQSDADADGDSDGGDFLAWQRNFGRVATSTPANGAVPEPATATLMLAALVGVFSACAVGNSRGLRERT